MASKILCVVSYSRLCSTDSPIFYILKLQSMLYLREYAVVPCNWQIPFHSSICLVATYLIADCVDMSQSATHVSLALSFAWPCVRVPKTLNMLWYFLHVLFGPVLSDAKCIGSQHILV